MGVFVVIVVTVVIVVIVVIGLFIVVFIVFIVVIGLVIGLVIVIVTILAAPVPHVRGAHPSTRREQAVQRGLRPLEDVTVLEEIDRIRGFNRRWTASDQAIRDA